MSIHIVRIWGSSPVQAEGYVSRRPFYFRARGDRYSFAVATMGRPGRYAAIDVACGLVAGFLLTRPYGWPGGLEASAMSHEVARQLIRECATAYAQLEKQK